MNSFWNTDLIVIGFQVHGDFHFIYDCLNSPILMSSHFAGSLGLPARVQNCLETVEQDCWEVRMKVLAKLTGSKNCTTKAAKSQTSYCFD